jgi:energy-coupling factor transporter ATP-binding protein EcfA2
MEQLARRAENLTEAYRLLDPNQPLEGEWLERFYTERPGDASITPLINGLLIDSREDDKTLFAGHRGSGKTTELVRLEKALAPTHTVVRFSVESLLNLGDVDYADLLVMLGLQVFQQAKRSGINLDQKRLKDLQFWYTTHVLEDDESRRLQSEISAEVDAVVARFGVKFTTDPPKRRTVRAEAQANLSDLLQRLDGLLEDLRAKSGRRTLVIVDGLDKIYDERQVSDLFLKGANALLAPRCRIVYTVPLGLYYTNDLQQVRLAFTRNFILPNVKTMERDGSPCQEGQAMLKQVLNQRLMPTLLTPEAVDRLVMLSGGLLKELITLAREAVLHARGLYKDQGPVQLSDVEYAARQVRNTYRAGLTEEQYQELERLYKGGRFTNNEVTRQLLHNLSLLEYNSGDVWWAIHPIVRPLLEERINELRTKG